MEEIFVPISGFLYSELEIHIFLPNLEEGRELCAPISGFLYSELEIHTFLPNLEEGRDSKLTL